MSDEKDEPQEFRCRGCGCKFWDDIATKCGSPAPDLYCCAGCAKKAHKMAMAIIDKVFDKSAD